MRVLWMVSFRNTYWCTLYTMKENIWQCFLYRLCWKKTKVIWNQKEWCRQTKNTIPDPNGYEATDVKKQVRHKYVGFYSTLRVVLTIQFQWRVKHFLLKYLQKSIPTPFLCLSECRVRTGLLLFSELSPVLRGSF